MADIGPDLSGKAFQLTGKFQNSHIADARIGAGNVSEHLQVGSPISLQSQFCGGGVAAHIHRAGIGSVLCDLSGRQSGNITANQVVGYGIGAIQAPINSEGCGIALSSYGNRLTADGNADTIGTNHPLTISELVISGIDQHGAIGLQISGGILLVIRKHAHVFRCHKFLLVTLDESIRIGKSLLLTAGHGNITGIACAGDNGEGHIKGVFPGNVVSIGGLGIRAAGCFQLNLKTGNAVLLHFLPLTGEIAGSIAGVRSGGVSIVLAIGVFVAGSGAVLVQIQQKCGSQHGGKLALFGVCACELEALGGRRGFGCRGGGFCRNGFSFAASGEQGGHHRNGQDQCQSLFHCFFLLFFTRVS